MPEYFIILLLFLGLGVFIHTRYRIKLYKSRRQMVYTILAFLTVAIIWDQFAIWRGHWTFGNQYLLGPYIGYMPIEEYGFAIICTYFVLVLYRFVEKRFH